MDFDWTQIGTAITTAAFSIWAAYQNWDDQTIGVKILMVGAPVALITLLLVIL